MQLCIFLASGLGGSVRGERFGAHSLLVIDIIQMKHYDLIIAP